jgi:hypothetical protein
MTDTSLKRIAHLTTRFTGDARVVKNPANALQPLKLIHLKKTMKVLGIYHGAVSNKLQQ